MAKVTVYKNSKLATACSIIGYLMIIGGVYFMFNDEPLVGAIVAVLGIGFKVLAGFINQRKIQKMARRSQK